MPNERISISFKPIDGASAAFHMTILYYKSDGTIQYIEGYPSQDASSINILQSAITARNDTKDISTHLPSAYGYLTGDSGTQLDTSNQAERGIIYLNGNTSSPLDQITVASGSDLSGTWSSMVSIGNSIINQHYTYSPTTLNSNSFAMTVLRGVGLSSVFESAQYSFNARMGDYYVSGHPYLDLHWTPAADVELPNFTPASSDSPYILKTPTIQNGIGHGWFSLNDNYSDPNIQLASFVTYDTGANSGSYSYANGYIYVTTASVNNFINNYINKLANQYAELSIPKAATLIYQGMSAQQIAQANQSFSDRQNLVQQWVQFLNDHANQISYNELPVTPQALADARSAATFNQVATIFGSTLGRLIGGGSLIIGTASGSVISAVAMSVGQQVFHSGYAPIGPDGIGWTTGNIFKDFGNNLSYLGTSASIGAVSSYLAGEFTQAVGLSGPIGQVFGVVASSALQYEATQLVAQSGIVGNLLDGAAQKTFGDTLDGNIAGFVGTELASLVVTPHTIAESTLASLGSAVGVLEGSAIGAGLSHIFGSLGSLAGPIGTVIGAFIGFILGDLLGSLFGSSPPPVPTASAETILLIPLAQYGLGTETSANGGDLQLSDMMAKAARDTLNGIIYQITGFTPHFVSNTVSPTQAYGVNGTQIYVKLGGSSAAQTNVATADTAVSTGVLWALPQTKIIGGDIFLKRVINNVTEQSLTDLLGDMQIASDYEKYMQSRAVIDSAISASWNSLSAGDQAFYTANKSFMTRAISASQLPLAGNDVTFYNANKAQVDRIVGSISVSSFAAGWIVTLARAAEMGLNNFTASDFYGGLGGFLQSFGFANSGSSLHYEDVAVSFSGGNLSLTNNGTSGAGTFSLLAQASTDGRSVTIANFAAVMGYTVQTPGTISNGNDIETNAGSYTSITVGPGQAGQYYYVPYPGIYVNIPATNGGDDIIIGGNGNDNLSAGAGNVWIQAGSGTTTINGGAGRDVLLGGSGSDTISAGSGDTYMYAGSGNSTLTGGAGNDVFVAGTGTDVMNGGSGSNIFVLNSSASKGHDTITGAGSNNTVSFERFSTAVNFALTGGTQSVNGDTISNIQNIIGSGHGDTLTASAAGSNIYDSGSGNAITGGAGNDTIEGGSNSYLDGGAGNNTISFAHSAAGVYVDLSTNSTIGGEATGEVIKNFQNIIGSNYGDELKGTGYGSVLTGGAGTNWFDATAGADTYKGGTGYNTIDYSLTNFTSATQTVTTTIPYNPITGQYTPYTITYQQTVGAINVAMNADGTGTVTGHNANGSLVTHSISSIQQIIGPAANSIFSDAGTALSMTFDGGGNNTYNGGTGSNTFVYASGYGASTINATNSGSNTIKIKSGVTFDDLWVANSGGNLQIGIRGQSGYIQANSDFATAGNDVIKTLDLAGAAQVDLTTINNVYTGSGANGTLYASATTSNLIFGYGSYTNIYASNNQVSQTINVIDAGKSTSGINIYTSSGNNEFLFERGDGHQTIYSGGGSNKVIFGPTVGASDVIYQVVGNDLYIGVQDPTNAILTASQVADNLRIVNGGLRYGDGVHATNFSVVAGGTTTNLNQASIAWTAGGRDPNLAIGGGHKPIVLDLTGDGLELTSASSSDIVTKDSNGNVLRSGWVGPTNGILALDRSGDGQINNLADISFIGDKAGATSDLQGLAGWDSNGDGVIDANDPIYSKLLVWVDRNHDGHVDQGDLFTLAQLGIASINLNGTPTGYTAANSSDSFYSATTSFTRTDGSVGTAYDVTLGSQFLSGPQTPSDVTTLPTSANATIGYLKAYSPGATNDGSVPTLATQNAAAQVDFSGNGGLLSNADAAQWASYLDPTLAAARRAEAAAGAYGNESLGSIRQTANDDSAVLQYIDRGARDPRTREQAFVIDFAGGASGPQLIDPANSPVFMDVNHTGTPQQIGWVGANEGMLVYDHSGIGQIDPSSDLSFLSNAPGASNNFQGLAALDANGDGVLDASDAAFAHLMVWRDTSGTGIPNQGVVQTLAQAGIQSIQLSATGLKHGIVGDGGSNSVLGISSITMTDGSVVKLYDVALGYADNRPLQQPQTGVGLNSQPASSASSSQSGSGSSSAQVLGNTPQAPGGSASAGVSLSQGGGNGPADTTLGATATNAQDSQWWAQATASQSLANAGSSLPGNDNGVTVGGSAPAASGAPGDAATLQQQALLAQSIASLPQSSGGSAAVWNRATPTSAALQLAASASSSSVTAPKTGTGG